MKFVPLACIIRRRSFLSSSGRAICKFALEVFTKPGDHIRKNPPIWASQVMKKRGECRMIQKPGRETR
jgi:hypothetical protein